MLYNKLPISGNSKQYADALRLKKEVVRLKREMGTVSAQDEFAKWAKLRRQHDKAVADYDKACMSPAHLYSLCLLLNLVFTAGGLQSSRSNFDTTATALRFIITQLLRFFPQYYYSRTPTFWLPAGWVPGYVEWLLSFPRAPKGSISIQVWGFACAAVIRMVGEAITAAWALVQMERVEKAKDRGREEVKMEAKGKKEL